MNVPGDFLEEIDRELGASSDRLSGESARLARLVELHRIALAASLSRGRAVSVVEVIDDSTDERHVTELVRSLRGTRGEQ